MSVEASFKDSINLEYENNNRPLFLPFSHVLFSETKDRAFIPDLTFTFAVKKKYWKRRILTFPKELFIKTSLKLNQA